MANDTQTRRNISPYIGVGLMLCLLVTKAGLLGDSLDKTGNMRREFRNACLLGKPVTADPPIIELPLACLGYGTMEYGRGLHVAAKSLALH